MPVRIELASDMAEVREIFREYADSIGVDLSFQNFEAELAALPGFYATILIARSDDALAGCVALRDLGGGVCEMKRLYVRPPYRGRDLGRELAARVIEQARAAGYRAIRLDTLPAMQAAAALYQSLGFREVGPYRFNPIPGSRFFELAL